MLGVQKSCLKVETSPSSVYNMLGFMSDPLAVAKFQRFCGLSVCKDDVKSSKNDSASEHFDSKAGHNEEESTTNDVECDARFDPKTSVKFQGKLKYNPIVHFVFLFGTELGNELFYITFFPFVYWNMDEFVGRRLVFLWVFTMYLGQVLKELLKWPRPSPDKVIVLENCYESEYSMPSTHATVGAMVPFTMVYFTYGRWEYPLAAGIIFFCIWCGAVTLSRLYVGVHFVQDLFAGSTIAAVMIYTALPYLDLTFEKTLASPNAAIFIVVIHITLLLIYPTSDEWTSSRGDTGRIVAVGCGCLLALWRDFYVNKVPIVDPYEGLPRPMFTNILPWVALSVARFLVGICILFPVKTVIKAFMHNVLPQLLPKSNENIYKKPSVELPYIFTTYSIIGYFAFYVAPKAFAVLGINM